MSSLNVGLEVLAVGVEVAVLASDMLVSFGFGHISSAWVRILCRILIRLGTFFENMWVLRFQLQEHFGTVLRLL